MRAFIELVFLRGLLGLNYHNIEVLYNPIMGPQPFVATMRQNRLEFLYRNVSFDDFHTRSQRWPNDRFSAFRVFEIFCPDLVQIFCLSMIPDEYLCLNEILYPVRNRLSFKWFNPANPPNLVCFLNQ